MTGIFNMRPPKPKLSLIWDVDILFKYFEQQGGRGGGELFVIRCNFSTETYNPTAAAWGSQTQYS